MQATSMNVEQLPSVSLTELYKMAYQIIRNIEIRQIQIDSVQKFLNSINKEIEKKERAEEAEALKKEQDVQAKSDPIKEPIENEESQKPAEIVPDRIEKP